MTESTARVPTCFVIMPITTPGALDYGNDSAHFAHVLDHLFEPAVKAAGYRMVPPAASGADIIHAEIVRQLEQSDLVLCDMSTLNANVFFELGIRTAVDKPVALVTDSLTASVPFDASIQNYLTYDALLVPWTIGAEVVKLTDHIRATAARSEGRNPMWKIFGLTSRAEFEPEVDPVEAKVDLLLRQVDALADRTRGVVAGRRTEPDDVLYRRFLASFPRLPTISISESPAALGHPITLNVRLGAPVAPESSGLVDALKEFAATANVGLTIDGPDLKASFWPPPGA